MKAIRTKLSTFAIALLLACGLTSPSMAGSSDFSGIYGALWASAGGGEVSGTHTAGRDATGTVTTNNAQDITRGVVGAVFPLAGYEVGFNLPLGDKFFIGFGHSWTQDGTATLARTDDGNAQKVNNVGGDAVNPQGNAHLTADSLKQVYFMPSVSIFDNSAVYAKFGRSIANTTLTGDVEAGSNPGNLTGDTWGIGTISMTPSGIFVKTEGSFTQFNDIRIVGVGGSNALVEGNPKVVAGTVALGFKF